MYGARTVLPSALMLRAHCLGRAGSLPRPVCYLCPGAQECTEEVQLSSYPDHWPKLGGYRSWGTGEESGATGDPTALFSFLLYPQKPAL